MTIKRRTWSFNLLQKLGFFPNVSCFGKIKVIQSLNIQGQGKFIFNDGLVIGVYPSPSLYHGEFYLESRHKEAKIEIGKKVFINNNAIIIADKSSITIGDGTLIGPNFVCFDSNFHPLSADKRLSNDYQCKPVSIGENVFIGSNVMILQGVSIGNNSVIGAGSVITSDVPDNKIVKAGKQLDYLDLR
ncbi:hypothetical protein K1B30_001334 [Vibrio parahaemolyticus]|nr:hypothetical protein [Vibrio parahaemolyticus]EIU6801140.1 hypothetical protein [Vibrio parahaemolyticus]